MNETVRPNIRQEGTHGTRIKQIDQMPVHTGAHELRAVGKATGNSVDLELPNLESFDHMPAEKARRTRYHHSIHR
jgi:hypothetical protein